MKCPKCGNDLFPGQFACEKCGWIVVEPKKEKKEKDKDGE